MIIVYNKIFYKNDIKAVSSVFNEHKRKRGKDYV